MSNLEIADVVKRAYAMPLTNPSFPPGPYRFFDREYVIITYRTTREALEAQRNQQGNAKQDPRHGLRHRQILTERVADINDTDEHQHAEGRQEPLRAA